MTKADKILYQIQSFNIERLLFDIIDNKVGMSYHTQLWDRLVSMEPNITMLHIITRHLTNPSTFS